jgi:hypothetical protein
MKNITTSLCCPTIGNDDHENNINFTKRDIITNIKYTKLIPKT